MPPVGTVLLLTLAPLAVIAVVTLLTVLPSMSRTPRYRPGQPWEHDPVRWTADPPAAPSATRVRVDEREPAAAGGARGTW